MAWSHNHKIFSCEFFIFFWWMQCASLNGLILIWTTTTLNNTEWRVKLNKEANKAANPDTTGMREASYKRNYVSGVCTCKHLNANTHLPLNKFCWHTGAHTPKTWLQCGEGVSKFCCCLSLCTEGSCRSDGSHSAHANTPSGDISQWRSSSIKWEAKPEHL